jgi:hypothetical protein
MSPSVWAVIRMRDQERTAMKTAHAARRWVGARGLVVGVAAAVVALGAGQPVAAQPGAHTYKCEDGAGGFGVAAGVRCQVVNGAQEQGVLQATFIITFPSGIWTCHSGLAVMPVLVSGRGCTGGPVTGDGGPSAALLSAGGGRTPP